jgi:sulfur relay protein TusB/DsrH
LAQNLILYGYSGFDGVQMANLTSITKNLPACAVVLMEDAVIGTVTTGINTYKSLQAAGVGIYCIIEDRQARGMDDHTLIPGIQPITYSKLIDLIENTPRVISWL